MERDTQITPTPGLPISEMVLGVLALLSPAFSLIIISLLISPPDEAVQSSGVRVNDNLILQGGAASFLSFDAVDRLPLVRSANHPSSAVTPTAPETGDILLRKEH